MPVMTTSGFHTTSWTLIRAAADSPTADSREALATLCQRYWHPVYAFIRRHGYDREQSQDLTQGFFALLIEKNYLLDTDSKRGKFRSLLLTAAKHFLASRKTPARECYPVDCRAGIPSLYEDSAVREVRLALEGRRIRRQRAAQVGIRRIVHDPEEFRLTARVELLFKIIGKREQLRLL